MEFVDAPRFPLPRPARSRASGTPATKVDMTKLETLAHGVLFPSIGRPVLPRWLAPRVDAGLGGVVLYGRDIRSREQVAQLTSALHALRDHVIIATDEEGG